MRIISGKFRGRKLYTPQDNLTRPTSDRTRQALFNILEHGLNIKWEGLRVLDLYAGTGALGIEALSRGASFCLFVDHHLSARAVLQKNIAPFPNTALSSENISHLSPNDSSSFDVVFLDPPYGKNLVPMTLERLSSGHYLKENALLVIEVGYGEEVKMDKIFSVLKEKTYGKTRIIIAQYLK